MTTQAWNTSPRPAAPAGGVHLPFTAPLLAGVRGRMQKRSLDFVLPNPSGGRGTYVVSWAQAAGLAAPTLHDAVLAKRLHDLPALTPPAARALSRAVAAEGYAGRPAAEAAIRAQARLDAESLRLWSRLLLALVQRSDIPANDQGRVLAGLGAAGPGVVTGGFTAAALRLGWEPAGLADALDQVSASHVALLPDGRAERLLGLLGAMLPGLLADQAQAAHDPGPSAALLGRILGIVTHWLSHAQALLDDAARSLADPVALLGRWRTDPAAALAPARSAEEALDGWDRICLLWMDAGTLSARLRLLPEIWLLVRLAGTSAGDPETASPAGAAGPAQTAALEPPHGAARAVSGAEAAREAPAPGLVERNERVRARELALEHGDG